MAAVSHEDKVLMLEAELHGIDVELSIKRAQHRQITKELEDLEADRVQIRTLLAYERK